MSAYYLFFSLLKIFIFYFSVIQVIQIVKNLHKPPRKNKLKGACITRQKKQNTYALYIKKYIQVRERDRNGPMKKRSYY